jgi:hypothetical protein
MVDETLIARAQKLTNGADIHTTNGLIAWSWNWSRDLNRNFSWSSGWSKSCSWNRSCSWSGNK